MNETNDEAMKKITVIVHDWYTDSISSFEAMEDVVYVLTHDLGWDLGLDVDQPKSR